MKTYTVEVSGEKAISILMDERQWHLDRISALDQKIQVIQNDLNRGTTPTNGHPVHKRLRPMVDAISGGIDILNGRNGLDSDREIKKTASGRSAKGETEAMLLDYLRRYAHDKITAQALASSVKANYSTVYRSLKKLEKRGLVSFDSVMWHKSEKLKEGLPA